MKIVGIVVEYNPFHNGHLYHIEKTKELSNCDALVAVMSGNYVQRGEPSCIDKFKKAYFALNNGVDLVVELPTVYATQSADLFAYGAISILNKLNVSEIYFGSEIVDTNKFQELTEKLDEETTNNSIKEYLKQGYSYPKSLSLALHNDSDFFTPNNILGIQYLKAIKKINPSIKAIPIQRINSNYNDQTVNDSNIASATAIRNLINEGKLVSKYVPRELSNLKDITTWQDFNDQLVYKLKSSSIESLRSIHQVEEGLEYKLFELAKGDISYAHLVNELTSKRYTRSRINRILLNILLNITKDEISKIDLLSDIKYVRILGMTNNGKKVLGSVDKSTVDVLTSLKDNYSLMSDIELRASKVYSSKTSYTFQREYKQPIIIKGE